MYINVPNFFSILRIVSIPLLIILLSYDQPLGAFIVFVCAAITDALDGFFARCFKQKTTVGAYLDPIADKLLLTSSFVVFAFMGLIPKWLTILVVSRDVIIAMGILVLLLTEFSVEIRPSIISKCTTVLQLFTIGLRLFLEIQGQPLPMMAVVYWITGALTVVSGIQYINRGSRIIGEPRSEG